MTDQHKAPQGHGADYPFSIVCEIGDPITRRGRIRLSPTTVVERNASVPIRQQRDYLVPSPRRPAPIVQKNQGGLPYSAIPQMDVNSINRNLHGFDLSESSVVPNSANCILMCLQSFNSGLN
jgi:hypothetical protein